MSFNSKIILGTAQFGTNYGINNSIGIPNQDQVNDILEFAMNNDIQMLDTAVSYGDSEQKIGSFHKFGKHFKCITKVGREAVIDTIESLVDHSIKKLNSNLYAILSHNIQDHKNDDRFWEEIKKLKYKGICKKIGFSIYSPHDIDFLEDIIHSIDIIQIPYNVFDRRFEAILPDLKTSNIEIHSRSAFLQGLFFKKIDTLGPHFSPVKQKINDLNDLAKEKEISLNHILLGFCLLNQKIDKVIIGVDTLDNLKKNLDVYEYLDELKKIKENLNNFIENNEKILLPYNWNA